MATKKKASKATPKKVAPSRKEAPKADPRLAKQTASAASGALAARPAAVMTALASALGSFQKRDWALALQRLKAIAKDHPAEVEVADRVRSYIRICERNLEEKKFSPKSADDHYQIGIVRLNQGEFDDAIKSLDQAAGLEPKNDRAVYAKAAALCLKGERPGALAALRAAVELNAENRVFAANDSDFERLRDEPEFTQIVGESARPN